MKTALMMCIMIGACASLPTSSPPHRHVYWDRPHHAAPSWLPEQVTWIQKVYYTLIEHFGSAIASGFGVLFGPLGPFVSSFSQPYISTYVSRLTSDVVARSLDESALMVRDENTLTSVDQKQRPLPSKSVGTVSGEHSSQDIEKYPEETLNFNDYQLTKEKGLLLDESHDKDSH